MSGFLYLSTLLMTAANFKIQLKLNPVLSNIFPISQSSQTHNNWRFFLNFHSLNFTFFQLTNQTMDSSPVSNFQIPRLLTTGNQNSFSSNFTLLYPYLFKLDIAAALFHFDSNKPKRILLIAIIISSQGPRKSIFLFWGPLKTFLTPKTLLSFKNLILLKLFHF